MPKGHAAFIANNFIIRGLPKSGPTADILFSAQAYEMAEHLGI